MPSEHRDVMVHWCRINKNQVQFLSFSCIVFRHRDHRKLGSELANYCAVMVKTFPRRAQLVFNI